MSADNGTKLTCTVYVVFFYVVWQILTRSDDNEILSHLPPALQNVQHSFERSPSPQQPYHLPYALPQIPSPITPNAEATATWRIVIGTIVYPIYIAITLIAIPMPFLISGLNLIFSVINTILYPVTSTFRLLARTFIIAPLNVVRSFLLALYPVYVFVGGVVGAGAFMGVIFGWAGRLLTNLLIRPSQRSRKSKRSKSIRRSRDRSASKGDDEYVPPSRSRPVSGIYEAPRTRPTSGIYDAPRSRPVSASFESRSRPVSMSYERRFFPIVDVVEIDDEMLEYENVHATGREGVVVGVRRRNRS